jgi:hypothetical protein
MINLRENLLILCQNTIEVNEKDRILHHKPLLSKEEKDDYALKLREILIKNEKFLTLIKQNRKNEFKKFIFSELEYLLSV